MNFNPSGASHIQDKFGPTIRSHGLMDRFAPELSDSLKGSSKRNLQSLNTHMFPSSFSGGLNQRQKGLIDRFAPDLGFDQVHDDYSSFLY